MTAETPRTSNVFVVDRGEPKLRGGQGLLAGLGVVIRHFGKAFTNKIESPAESSGLFTVQYPEERLVMPEAYRNFPILLYDDKTGHELCTSCFQCERICPPQVIHMTQASDPTTGKPVPAVAEFMIEYDACMSCGLCAEVCPFDAIKMDHEFELSNSEHSTMTVDKAGLDRPVSYYESLAPNMWAEVRDGAMKKLQGNMKRRSGDIGIAPPMVGKVQTSAPAPAAKPAAPAPTPAAPAAPASVGANMSDEKKARLEAIRAAKAAQASGAAPEAAAPATPDKPVAAVGANMSDEKKARLEAIRAAKAAQAAQEGGATPEAAPQATAPAPEAPAKPVAAVGANMSDEKKARLEAIRAAKAAQAAQESGTAPEATTEAPAEAAAPAPEAPTPPVAAVGANMSDEKKARLEAIRAAKAAAKRESSDES